MLLIVWGGTDDSNWFNTGGRYNPITDSWAATGTTNAPNAREAHTAVWTESEVILWGGEFGGGEVLNSGGKYNPVTDSWTATNTTNAPTARQNHTAVWTGSNEMIVWGGQDLSQNGFNTGGKYCSEIIVSTPPPRFSPTPRPRPTPAPRPSS